MTWLRKCERASARRATAHRSVSLPKRHSRRQVGSKIGSVCCGVCVLLCFAELEWKSEDVVFGGTLRPFSWSCFCLVFLLPSVLSLVEFLHAYLGDCSKCACGVLLVGMKLRYELGWNLVSNCTFSLSWEGKPIYVSGFRACAVEIS